MIDVMDSPNIRQRAPQVETNLTNTEDEDLRAFAMLLKAAIAACGAIYYFTTRRKAPPAKKVLKDFS